MNPFKDKLSVLSTTITTIVALFGGVYGFRSCQSSQPNLIVEVDSVQLKCSLKTSEIYNDLVKIEEQHGIVTADKINQIKDLARKTDYYDRAQVEYLLTMVYFKIDSFQRKIKGNWDTTDIHYFPAGFIRWPDQTKYDILNDPKSEKLFPKSAALVKDNPEKLSKEVIKEVQRQAYGLYRPFGAEGNAQRLIVANELRAVRSKLEIIKNPANYCWEVTVTVINKSTSINLIQSFQKLFIGKGKNSASFSLRLLNSEQRKLEGWGIYKMVYRSKFLSEMEGVNADQTFELFRDGFNYTLQIPDIDNNTWPATGKLALKNVIPNLNN